jgi:hypothetical protein
LALATAAVANFNSSPVFAQDASTLDQVKAKKQLRIGVTSAEPWFFKDPISEKWTGIGIARGEKLAANLGVEMVPVETTWANAVAALQANQIDLMFVLDPTDERKKAIDFPDAPAECRLQPDREGDRPRAGVRPRRRLGQSLAAGKRSAQHPRPALGGGRTAPLGAVHGRASDGSGRGHAAAVSV